MSYVNFHIIKSSFSNYVVHTLKFWLPFGIQRYITEYDWFVSTTTNLHSIKIYLIEFIHKDMNSFKNSGIVIQCQYYNLPFEYLMVLFEKIPRHQFVDSDIDYLKTFRLRTNHIKILIDKSKLIIKFFIHFNLIMFLPNRSNTTWVIIKSVEKAVISARIENMN